MKRYKFEPNEMLALRPDALGEYFDRPDAGAKPYESKDGVCIVNVRGPLMHHESPCCDSYDAIKTRVAAALEQKPTAVVLSIDSPGGLVSGCFDTSNEIAAICEAAGVPLYAYVDGQACSAAYALACVAEKIVIPDSAECGSIGCIAEMVSTARLDAAMGLDRRVITSGLRKADGNPGLPITDESEAAVALKVNRMAAIFADHVAAHRPMSIADVMKMQAGVVIGSEAVPALCDAVMGLDEMLAAIASGTFAEAETAAPPPENKSMKIKGAAEEEKKNPFASAKAGYRAALKSIADDKDADEKAKAEATAALAAMDKDEKPEAADDAPPAKDKKEPDGDEPSGEKAISAVVLRALAPVVARLDSRDASDAKAQADAEKLERSTLLASRPDFDATTRALAEGATLANLREFVKSHPKRKVVPAATGGSIKTTRAVTQVGTGEPGAPLMQAPKEASAMQIAMGTVKQSATVFQRGGQLVIGAMPEQMTQEEIASLPIGAAE